MICLVLSGFVPEVRAYVQQIVSRVAVGTKEGSSTNSTLQENTLSGSVAAASAPQGSSKVSSHSMLTD